MGLRFSFRADWSDARTPQSTDSPKPAPPSQRSPIPPIRREIAQTRRTLPLSPQPPHPKKPPAKHPRRRQYPAGGLRRHRNRDRRGRWWCHHRGGAGRSAARMSASDRRSASPHRRHKTRHIPVLAIVRVVRRHRRSLIYLGRNQIRNRELCRLRHRRNRRVHHRRHIPGVLRRKDRIRQARRRSRNLAGEIHLLHRLFVGHHIFRPLDLRIRLPVRMPDPPFGPRRRGGFAHLVAHRRQHLRLDKPLTGRRGCRSNRNDTTASSRKHQKT
jgi:hypothetical protein